MEQSQATDVILMEFDVKDCDPTTGEPDFDEGFPDECGTLDSLPPSFLPSLPLPPSLLSSLPLGHALSDTWNSRRLQV